MRFRKLICLAGAFVLAFAALPMNVQAGPSQKEIKSISLRIKVKVEAGDSLPDLGIGSGSGDNYVDCSTSTLEILEADWTGSKTTDLKIGDEPRIKMLITPVDDEEYELKDRYTSSSFKVSGGEYVSSRRDGGQIEVTVKIDPIKGTYMEPEDAGWDDKKMGRAEWKKGDDGSSAYELQLYRDKKSVFKINNLRATSYNFYPYMTEPGDYHYKVRSIPYTESDKKYAKKSDWIESDDLHIDIRDVSDGAGQQGKSVNAENKEATVGFQKENGIVYYKKPDGSYVKNDWLNLDGKWFLFDQAGAMLTGWQQRNGNYYYLDPRGEAATGWQKVDGVYYYMWPDSNGGGAECSMARGWQVVEGRWHFFQDSGAMHLGWLFYDGKWYYLNELDNELKGSMMRGWLNRNQNVYYLNEDGSMAEGWTVIDGRYYYFYPGNGAMAVDTWVDGFYLDQYGVWGG